MKLLVVTQTVDSEDLYLGFFHRWLEVFSTRFETIEVVCLKEGTHSLPQHVRVHSLGKERGRKLPLIYAVRFLWCAFRLRKEYDAVFVHMNEEYVLIAGWLWKLLGKRVYLWRNHYAGSWLTHVAASFCTKVFFTSRHSYTAQCRNAVRMPVGVDTDRFVVRPSLERKKNSILFFGRMMPSKQPGLLLEALIELRRLKTLFTATFAGSPPQGEEQYLASLKQRAADAGLMDAVLFVPGVPHHKAPRLYGTHQVYVNLGRSGMLDKAIFEAAASGCTVIAASDDWKEMAGEDFHFDGTKEGLAAKILDAFALHRTERAHAGIVNEHSLTRLGERLSKEIR